MKDATAALGAVRLARLSIYDRIAGVRLNDVLYGRANVSPTDLAEFVDQRSMTGQIPFLRRDEK